jgi:hypothetical protein
LVALAVKFAGEPAQMAPPGPATLMAGVTTGLTVIVKGLESAVGVVAQVELLVSTQLTISPLFNPEVVYVLLFVPTPDPFTCH